MTVNDCVYESVQIAVVKSFEYMRDFETQSPLNLRKFFTSDLRYTKSPLRVVKMHELRFIKWDQVRCRIHKGDDHNICVTICVISTTYF